MQKSATFFRVKKGHFHYHKQKIHFCNDELAGTFFLLDYVTK
jgi:hypothetical protein